jgi:hypothetical protein
MNTLFQKTTSHANTTFFIEKSKRRMIEEDIRSAFALLK